MAKVITVADLEAFIKANAREEAVVIPTPTPTPIPPPEPPPSPIQIPADALTLKIKSDKTPSRFDAWVVSDLNGFIAVGEKASFYFDPDELKVGAATRSQFVLKANNQDVGWTCYKISKVTGLATIAKSGGGQGINDTQFGVSNYAYLYEIVNRGVPTTMQAWVVIL